MNSTTHRKETFRETLACEPCGVLREHLVWLTPDVATRMCTGCGVWWTRERKAARKRRNRAARQVPAAAPTPNAWAQQEREARRSLAKAARRRDGRGHAFGS